MCKAERAARIGEAVGNPREPTSGLPAGCPFAAMFLSTVTQPWRQLRDGQARPSVRTWVDDCTAFAQGEQTAVALAGEAAFKVQTVSLKVNRPKSGVLGSSTRLTAAMRAAAGPLFGCTEALKDLGVIQGAGPAEQDAAMVRWLAACSRLGKIARLSMPTQEKGRFAATAALSAGVFGTSCREQPDHVLLAMRRWVRHAAWQGGPAADYRILLWAGAIPIKADPVVAVLLAAARTVSLLAQYGHFELHQLERLWAAPDK